MRYVRWVMTCLAFVFLAGIEGDCGRADIPLHIVALSDDEMAFEGEFPTHDYGRRPRGVPIERSYIIIGSADADVPDFKVSVDLDMSGISTNCDDATILSPLPLAVDGDEGAILAVRFVPNKQGPFRCRLVLASDRDDVKPFEFDLAGWAALEDVSISSPFGMFEHGGDYNVGAPMSGIDVPLRITNHGEAASVLRVTSVTTVCSNCTTSILGPTNGALTDNAIDTTVRVVPSGGGRYSARVTVSSSDPDERELVFTLSGDIPIAMPEIELSPCIGPMGPTCTSTLPAVLSGGTDMVGAMPIGMAFRRAYIIKNFGDANLTVMSPTFPMNNNCSVTITLQPATTVFSSLPFGSTILELAVTPTAAGPFACRLSLGNNDANENPYAIDIIGTGTTAPELEVLDPNATVLANNATFGTGSHPDGTVRTYNFVLKNTGTAPLTISSSTSTIVSGNSCTGAVDPASVINGGQPIAAGQQVTFPYSLAIAGPGPCTIRVIIGSNDADENPFSFDVTATGVAPPGEIAVEGFGGPVASGGMDDMGLGSPGQDRLVVYYVYNEGTNNLVITSADLPTANQVNCVVTVEPSTTFPLTVPPMSSSSITLRVRPSALGAFSYRLVLPNNDTDENPYLVNGFGNSVNPAPAIVVRRGANTIPHDGSTNLGNTPMAGGQAVFTIQNVPGTVNLVLGTITFPAGTNCTLTLNGAPDMMVLPYDSTVFFIRYSSPAPGAYDCTFEIPSNASPSPYRVHVTGNAF